MKKLFGLGKGLESLIPTQKQKKPVADKMDDIFYVETSKIKPNEFQPRTSFNDEALADLAKSIKKYGVLQPLLVSKVEKETTRGIAVEYELIAGERRWRAAKLAKLSSIPVIVKNNFDESNLKLEVALVENVQREDLNPMEEAEAYVKLNKEFGVTQKEIADRVGKSREVVANSIRLMDLPANVKEALRSGKIARTHARSLLALKDEKQQQKAFLAILGGGVVVRDIEHTAREQRKGPGENPNRSKFDELQGNLSKNLGAPVLIKSSSKGGRIEIKFLTLKELNKIARTILD